MDASLPLSSLIKLTITSTIFILAIAPTLVVSKYNEQYTTCRYHFQCGILSNVFYPFWGGTRPSFCGRPGFNLSCPQGRRQHPSINIKGLDFAVVEINEDLQLMTIKRVDLKENVCAAKLTNTTLDYTLFDFPNQSSRNLTLHYNCSRGSSNRDGFTCASRYAFYTIDGDSYEGSSCEEIVTVPVQEEFVNELKNGSMSLNKGLDAWFVVEYLRNETNCSECRSSGGICGSDEQTMEFSCLCPEGPTRLACHPKTQGRNWKLKASIGFCAMVFGFILSYAVFLVYLQHYRRKYASSMIMQSNSSILPKLDVEKGIFLGLHIFSYEDLQKATNNFDEKKKLGDGGFGTVYFGKLKDGRAVAVKRLYENNYKRVKQFMNEVEILGRLRHQNLVTLYGFTSHQSRELLLVYEYVPNGTVADHLHGEREKPGALPWAIRLKIAIETATALAYLHASGIIHRDVKTNNILLDKTFCVKVADFGLSRLLPTNVPHILTAPQGTPGYVDPDYHQRYRLTDKSDVYSFGVVLIELISSKPAVDPSRHQDEIKLADLAMNKIVDHKLPELVDLNLGYQSDDAVQIMINAVAELAFRCLQNEKDLRPSMEEVLEVLKGICSDHGSEQKSEELDTLADRVTLLKSYPSSHLPDPAPE